MPDLLLIRFRIKYSGAVVQSVRISACHAEGRGFESRPHRPLKIYRTTLKILKIGAVVSRVLGIRISA